MALACATAYEAPRARLHAGLITVDHALQDGSASRAAGVRDWARTLNLDPAEVATVRVGRDGGPEAAARDARYAALDEAAERTGAAAILLGHTLDDQAETVLLGLARGSGARALAGMPAGRGRYRRPFLDLTRATTHAACAAAGLNPWQDPHNHDAAYARSRLRTLLPDLERMAPGSTAGLARSARLLRDDADLLDDLTSDLYAEAVGPTGVDIARLAAAPPALRTRALHRWAIALGAPPNALSSRHIAAMDALVMAYTGQGPTMLPGRITIHRQGTQLVRTS